MSAVESTVVLLPRFTTLVGGMYELPPLDVSRFGGAQLEFWIGEAVSLEGPVIGLPKVWLEESLDGINWPESASTLYEFSGSTYASRFFSIGFRLRWFRLRVEVRSDAMTMWCEGIMRAGGTGSHEWLRPAPPAQSSTANTTIGAAKQQPKISQPGMSIGPGKGGPPPGFSLPPPQFPFPTK